MYGTPEEVEVNIICRHNMKTYTMDGKTVYCIEPGVDITTTSYLGYDGFQASPL